MRVAWGRVRAYAGHLSLLAALGLVAALLTGGVPRLANEYTDRGLRGDVERLPYQVRDLTLHADRQVAVLVGPAAAAAQLPSLRARLPAPLPGLVQDSWFAGIVDSPRVGFAGPPPYAGACPPKLRLRAQTGYDKAVRIVEGRLPQSRSGTEALVSREAAGLVSLRVGSALTVRSSGGSTPLRIVGIFEPIAGAAPFWDGQRTGPVPCPDPLGGATYETTLLTDLPGIAVAGRVTAELTYEWRYRIDTARLAASDVPVLTTAVVAARRAPWSGLRLVTGLEGALRTFDGQLRGAQAVLAIVQTGLLATMVGLILLAALLMADRRREEFALLRARGGSAAAVGTRTLAETLLVVPVAVLAGWLVGTLLPGRPEGLELPLVAGLAAVTSLAPPIFAVRSHGRRGRPQSRPSARRLTAEVFVVLLAVLGVVLVRRRGLSGVVDPYLVSVPVLLAAAAALVAVRLLPWPLRQLGRITARARGLVPFLGLAQTGRGAPVNIGPLAILVVAIATGVFTAAVSGTVADARDRASDQEIAADVRLIGSAYAPETTDRLAALPGVAAVAPLLVDSGAPVTTSAGLRTQAQLLVVDGAAAGKVMASAGLDTRLPAALTGAAGGGGPAPAVVSPELAAEVGARGFVTVQGRPFAFRVAAVLPSLPTLEVGARRFIAVPWQALPVPAFQPIVPNRFLVAGPASPAALRETADAGQRAYRARMLGHEVTSDAELPVRTEVTTWAGHRRALEDTGVNGVLSFTFGAGAAGAVALALLAVGLTVLADAAGRGRTLSRLRTMGLSLRQGRRLLVYELVPLVAVAVVAGGTVGVVLPRLVGPALGLDGFTAGIAARTHVDAWLPLAALLLVAAALATAVLVESLVNRRMRLGEVLRLGEEN